MARALNVVLVLAVLAATAVAFVVAEGAKLQKSPLEKTAVSKIFSPDATITRIVSDGKVTRYGHRVASITFQLRSAQTLEIWIEDAHGHRVTSLLPSRHFRKGQVVSVVWDGTEPDGLAAPDGIYRPVVKLSHRTIVLPNPIRLDTKTPAISVPGRPHVVISPDGDGHDDSFSVGYRLSEPAHAILRVRPAAAQHAQQVEYTYFQRLTGTLAWNGKFDGKAAKPGNYVLYASAQDTAGNRSKGKPFAVVQVRYLVLARTRVAVKPGGVFHLRVSTDAPNVRWSLHGRSGVEPRGTLHFHAPKSPGVYHLYVQAAGHAARCTVVVA